jgi:cytochrome c biogenesis protein
MIGLVLGFYFQHRRIWLRYEDGMLHLAAHTNKNWFGLRKEIEKIVSESNIGLNIANMDQGGKRK